MKFTPFIVLGLSAVLLCGGCVDRQAQKVAKETQQFATDTTVHVLTAPVGQQDISQTIQIVGNITAAEDTNVGARQNGKITAVFVKDGDTVQAGQIIAEQDTSLLQAQVDQAVAQLANARSGLNSAISNAEYGPMKSRAAVNQARAQLRSAQASYEKTKKGVRPEELAQAQAAVNAAKTNLDVAAADRDRKESLLAEGAIAKNVYDQAESAYATAKQQFETATQTLLIDQRGNRPEDIEVSKEAVAAAQTQLQNALAQQKLDVLLSDSVNSARAQVSVQQAVLDQARTNLEQAIIRSPFSGQISGKPIQVGTMANAGTVVARIIGTSGLYYEGQIPQEQLQMVKIGAPVSIKIDGFGDKIFGGHVASFNPLGQETGRLFVARVMLDGNPPELKANMYARGTVLTEKIPSATVVPSTAVVQVDGKSTVFTVENGKAKAVTVTTGLQSGNMLQILSGVQPGTPIIVTGQNLVSDGSTVQIDKKVASLDQQQQLNG